MPPAAAVIESFGGDPSALVPLEGGQGASWRAGTVVVKPSGDDVETAFVAALCARFGPSEHVRVAAPLVSVDGRWSVAGWSATVWLPGRHEPATLERTLAVSHAFHMACAGIDLAWPAALAQRTDPWSTGVRVAWLEQAADPAWPAEVHDVIAALQPRLERVVPDRPSQVIHSDLVGNVLIADDFGLPPAVIDISPQYRPPGFADAIVVADSVGLADAPLRAAIGFLEARPDGDELLARALAFRVAAAAGLWQGRPDRVLEEIFGYRPLLALVT